MERRFRSPSNNFFVRGKQIPYPLYNNVRAYIIIYGMQKELEKRQGKSPFQAVLGWFLPILAMLGCLDRLYGICKWLVCRGVLKSGKAKMAKKNVCLKQFRILNGLKVRGNSFSR